MHSTVNSSRMSIRALVVGLVLAALAVPASVGPAAAAIPPDHGSTVTCRYRLTSGVFGEMESFEARLKRIVVTPPVLFAKSGRQVVGWRFVVWRLIDESADAQWQATYASPIQKRVASKTLKADFQTMRVGVTLPKGAYPYWVYYQVRLKLFWYRANGTLQSKKIYQMPDERLVIEGEYWEDASEYWDGYCHGLLKQSVDGPF